MSIELPNFLFQGLYRRRKENKGPDFGMIAITQPRRVAAITIAKRVAQEMGVELGTLVLLDSTRFDWLQIRIEYDQLIPANESGWISSSIRRCDEQSHSHQVHDRRHPAA